MASKKNLPGKKKNKQNYKHFLFCTKPFIYMRKHNQGPIYLEKQAESQKVVLTVMSSQDKHFLRGLMPTFQFLVVVFYPNLMVPAICSMIRYRCPVPMTPV